MARTLEKGPNKIQEICDILKKETLEPAKQQAEAIIAEAKAHGLKIIEEAQLAADQLLEAAHRKIAEDKNVFQSALSQASKQALESLRQSIETRLFNDQLEELIQKHAASPQIITDIIQSLLKGIEKEGLSKDLSALIPKTASAQSINALLGQTTLAKLRNQSVEIGNFGAGAQIKLHDKKITLDMSDGAIKELLADFVQKDFRKLIFGSK